jgi:hypothetical protein
VPSLPSMHSIKRVSEADLGISLQLGGRTFRHEKHSDSDATTLLLDENLTGCPQVYLVLHCLIYFQTDH